MEKEIHYQPEVKAVIEGLTLHVSINNNNEKKEFYLTHQESETLKEIIEEYLYQLEKEDN